MQQKFNFIKTINFVIKTFSKHLMIEWQHCGGTYCVVWIFIESFEWWKGELRSKMEGMWERQQDRLHCPPKSWGSCQGRRPLDCGKIDPGMGSGKVQGVKMWTVRTTLGPICTMKNVTDNQVLGIIRFVRAVAMRWNRNWTSKMATKMTLFEKRGPKKKSLRWDFGFGGCFKGSQILPFLDSPRSDGSKDPLGCAFCHRLSFYFCLQSFQKQLFFLTKLWKVTNFPVQFSAFFKTHFSNHPQINLFACLYSLRSRPYSSIHLSQVLPGHISLKMKVNRKCKPKMGMCLLLSNCKFEDWVFVFVF